MAQKSFVWKFFELSEDRKTSMCTLCRNSLAYHGGTSSMRNHLKLVHKKSADGNDGLPTSRQQSLTEFRRSSTVLGHGKYELITKSLAMMCAVDLRPQNIVNGKGFINYSHMLNPAYKVPSASTVQKYVSLGYENTKT